MSVLIPVILSYTFKSKNMSLTYAPVFIDPGLVNPVSWRHKFPRYSMFVPRMKGLTKNIPEGAAFISRTAFDGLKFGIF